MITLFHKRKTPTGIKKVKKIRDSTLLVLEEAEKHGIKWKQIPYTDLFKLQYKNQIKYFHYQIPSLTNELAHYSCQNKQVARNILLNADLSISKGYLIKNDDAQKYHFEVFNNLKKPLVVKATDGCGSDSVHININSQKEYLKAIKDIYDFHGKKKVDLLVEEMFEGDEYRILTTQKKILSVIKRLPANVIGDGKSTIEKLIKIKNQNPIRIKVANYHKIIIDKNLIEFLKKQKLTLESIVEKNKRVFLLPHSQLNMGFGGDTIDITDKIHPTVTKIVRKIMKSMPGLSLAGIDYMTKDIYAPQTADNYIIVEINSSPSLDWNQYPLEGPKRKIAYEFLKIMFPEINKG